MRIPGMPAGVGPSDIEGYLGRQKEQMNRFGPDARMALQDQLNTRHNSFGNRATEGLKGLADAIMQGVARAGNPGFKQSYMESENRYGQDQINAFKDARTANLENVQGGMGLDQMDPQSELSKAKQASYAPLFQKLGYPPEALKGQSAANIDSSLTLMAQLGGKEIEAMIKQYELQIERMRLQATAGKNEQDAEIDKQKARADAAKEVLKNSANARVLGIPIPFTSDVSGKDEDAARQVLVEQMKGSGTAPAEGDAPLGQTTVRDGVEYEWSPISKKYHPKAR